MEYLRRNTKNNFATSPLVSSIRGETSVGVAKDRLLLRLTISKASIKQKASILEKCEEYSKWKYVYKNLKSKIFNCKTCQLLAGKMPWISEHDPTSSEDLSRKLSRNVSYRLYPRWSIRTSNRPLINYRPAKGAALPQKQQEHYLCLGKGSK